MKILLYYKYVPVPNPADETKSHRELCRTLELKGRILLSAEGINGTCSGTDENIEKYKAASQNTASRIRTGISMAAFSSSTSADPCAFRGKNHPRMYQSVTAAGLSRIGTSTVRICNVTGCFSAARHATRSIEDSARSMRE